MTIILACDVHIFWLVIQLWGWFLQRPRISSKEGVRGYRWWHSGECSWFTKRFNGVTAILIDGKKLDVANVGDLRAVLNSNGKAEQITVDHEPKKEKSLVESRGGFVLQKPGMSSFAFSFSKHLVLDSCECSDPRYLALYGRYYEHLRTTIMDNHEQKIQLAY